MAPNKLILKGFFFLLILSTTQLKSQTEDCDCGSIFKQVIEKIEANYIGLRHHFQNGKKQAYEDHKSTFLKNASSISLDRCTEFLQDFLGYFEDGHLFVFELPVYTDEERLKMAEQLTPRVGIEEIEESIRKQKRSDEPEIMSLVGYYHDGSSKIGLVKEHEAFKAYILETSQEGIKPGELKASFVKTSDGYKGTYYSYGRVPRFVQPALYKEGTLLAVTSNALWTKLDAPFEREKSMVDLERGVDQPTITKIDDENVLFSIPSWAIDYQKFVSYVKVHKETLLGAKTLIFDIRGNRGGNGIYLSFFDLFADQSMPGGQGHVLASTDNQAYFERNMQFSKAIYKPVVEAIKKNLGDIVDGPKYPVRKFRRNKKSKTQNVAILADHACMSAAESFILHAKQAGSMVKTFGSPTAGVIDYTSVNAIKLNSCNQNIYFGYPTSTYHKEIPDNGYNKTGIIPDVPIDKGVRDKVQFIVDYYKQDK